MKRSILVIAILLSVTAYAVGQAHFYRGAYTNYSDILYTWKDGHLYSGAYTNYSDILLTYDGKHIYRGAYTNYSDILYTVNAPIPLAVMLMIIQ